MAVAVKDTGESPVTANPNDIELIPFLAHQIDVRHQLEVLVPIT